MKNPTAQNIPVKPYTVLYVIAYSRPKHNFITHEVG